MSVEPYLAAVRQWEDRVLALVDPDASAARQRAEQALDGPLKGWPLGVKDIIDIAGRPTGCNADFVPHEPAAGNAAIVQRLLELGAFVLAKTVTTTFAYFDPGPTRNPWNPAHTPGGSSSGSAAAVACGMVRLALGTQTAGSVNRPASFCGVVGFKPTFGRLPTDGVFPFSPSVDTVGFFTRRTADVQTAFAAVVAEQQMATPARLRVGLIEDCHTTAADDEMLAAVRAVGERLAAAGLDVRRASLPDSAAEAYPNHQTLIAAEVATVHQKLFTDFGSRYPPRLAALIRRGQGVSASKLEWIAAHRAQLKRDLGELFEAFDLLLTPSAPGPAPRGLDRTGDPRFNLIWTYLGDPALTLPARLSGDGLPLGVQLIGPAGQDAALLAAAVRVEEMLGFEIILKNM